MKLLLLLGMLAFLGGSSATASTPEKAEQPQEKSGGSLPGARLTFRETSRSASPHGELVHYALKAAGLPEGKSYSLTAKWMNGTTRVINRLHIDGSGRVLTEDGTEADLTLGKMFPGEFIEFTLAADDGTAKASVEIALFPIEAMGNGSCRLSVKPMSARGDAFLITGSGFKLDEDIKSVERVDGQTIDKRLKAKGDGSLKVVVFPGAAGRSGGTASLTASDTSCSVTIRYSWGSEMTRAVPERQAQTPGSQPSTQLAQARGEKAEAAYRKSDYWTLLDLLRELMSQDKGFFEAQRKAAAQGSATAQGFLGVIYEEGIGVRRDPAEAIRWFRRAADQGDATAQKYLGDIYRQGSAVRTDLREAMKWYLKAAEQKDGAAQAMLGLMYERGMGVQPDAVQAYKWYTVAMSHFEGDDREKMMQVRERVSAGMSAAEIEKAEQLASAWKPAKSD
jgi:tetratricopeptide (TPR) repeat protein